MSPKLFIIGKWLMYYMVRANEHAAAPLNGSLDSETTWKSDLGLTEEELRMISRGMARWILGMLGAGAIGWAIGFRMGYRVGFVGAASRAIGRWEDKGGTWSQALREAEAARKKEDRDKRWGA